MDRFAGLTGRQYHLVDYHGAPDADRVIVLMGSGAGAVREAVDALNAAGERVGVLALRLFRPFPTAQLLAALPPSTRTVVVLDRCKEPGAPFEPLHLDVLSAMWHSDPTHVGRRRAPAGHRRPLRAEQQGVHAGDGEGGVRRGRRRRAEEPVHRRHLDDVSHTSLAWDPEFRTDRAKVRAVFYGLGCDGTVGANKNTAKIIGGNTDMSVQAYFVYDSKKSGSTTISHVRVDEQPIDSSYLIDEATFVGVHQWSLLETLDVLALAAPGATVLLNTPYPVEQVWDRLPAEVQEQMLRQAGAGCTPSTPPPSPVPPASAVASTPSCRRASSRSPVCCPRRRRCTS